MWSSGWSVAGIMHGFVVEVETALLLQRCLMTAIIGSGTLESHVSPCTYRECSVALIQLSNGDNLKAFTEA
jgi:hypothetical protein